MKLLPAVLDALLDDLYNKGVRTFRAGGALGFDTVAALSVLWAMCELLIPNEKYRQAVRLTAGMLVMSVLLS